ncbi:MAG TPA: hypothetical protein PK158_12625, partial [Spirochaetota bacterium]|nr:hypothetical protein [Spirochaetota bacterium]
FAPKRSKFDSMYEPICSSCSFVNSIATLILHLKISENHIHVNYIYDLKNDISGKYQKNLKL